LGNILGSDVGAYAPFIRLPDTFTWTCFVGAANVKPWPCNMDDNKFGSSAFTLIDTRISTKLLQ
jgi:hypothetical protein